MNGNAQASPFAVPPHVKSTPRQKHSVQKSYTYRYVVAYSDNCSFPNPRQPSRLPVDESDHFSLYFSIQYIVYHLSCTPGLVMIDICACVVLDAVVYEWKHACFPLVGPFACFRVYSIVYMDVGIWKYVYQFIPVSEQLQLEIPESVAHQPGEPMQS